MNTKYIKLTREDWEFFKSMLCLCHIIMEAIANSDFTPSEAHKLTDKLQATERFFFEAKQRDLA